MVTGEYWWLIYLVFLAIPLARIIPRIASRRRGRQHVDDYYGGDIGYRTADAKPHTGPASVGRAPQEDDGGPPKTRRGSPAAGDRAAGVPGGAQAGAGQTNEMVVLGALHRGDKTFESIRKRTGMDEGVLGRALENLEDQQMIRVVQRQGLFGTKVELYPTDKGFRSYYS